MILSRLLLLAAAVFLTSPASAQSVCNSDSTFYIDIDELDDLDSAMNRDAREAGAPIRVDGIEFDLKTSGEAPADAADRCMADRLGRVRDALVDRDFFEPDADELAEAGFTKERALESMRSAIPFGMRDSYGGLIQDVVIYVSERPACADRGGLVMAMLMTLSRQPRDNSSWGGVAIMFAGLGSCAGSSGLNGPFMEYTRDDVLEAVFSDLEDIR